MNITRREFLTGIAIAVTAEGAPAPDRVSAYLHIGEDGRVTVFTGKVEIGQNIRTSLAQAVAEELKMAPERVSLIMGDTALTPYDSGTSGSRSTGFMAPVLRRAAAAAREMLLELAAERWKGARLEIADGRVRNTATGESAGFGDLTKGRKLERTIGGQTPAPPLGISVPKVNGRALVTGAHKFPYDFKLPGMLYGKVLRPPAFGAELASLETGGASVVREGNFAGVTAPDPRAAEAALAKLKPEWRLTPQPSGRELFGILKSGPGPALLEDTAAEVRLRGQYTLPYIAHAPLEPRVAVAEWKDGGLTVWTGTQRPFGVRQELMRAFNLPEERVRVIMPDMGSGYGGKHSGDAALEAARLARAAGKPVKVAWTRQEEFTWAYFRPAGVIDVAGGVRKDGVLTSWEQHNYNSGGAGLRSPYEVANRREEYHSARSPLRQGSYRALAATANHFARETMMDELAHELKMSPLEFRLKNAKDPRLAAVITAAAQRFAWPHSKASKQRGFGMAAGFEKGSYVATCVEVEADKAAGAVRVLTVVQAFECGGIVNPDHLRNQVEGCIMMGLGGAMFEAIEFENGRILNGRFARYRVPRFTDLPAIETVLLDRKDIPSVGAGETPIVGIAPAIGNAIFDATGVRLRSLPLRLAQAVS
ncbi:MAG: molybdopterin cofactor-binding domain-containing protein [Bryobacteraceae bacterium]